jgi:hypothetical protein
LRGRSACIGVAGFRPSGRMHLIECAGWILQRLSCGVYSWSLAEDSKRLRLRFQKNYQPIL